MSDDQEQPVFGFTADSMLLVWHQLKAGRTGLTANQKVAAWLARGAPSVELPGIEHIVMKAIAAWDYKRS